MTTFLQWNCRGYYSNFEKLVQLINICTPKCICLQELQLFYHFFFQPSEYKSPLTSIERSDNDRGGAGVLIRKFIPLLQSFFELDVMQWQDVSTTIILF